MCRLLLIMYHIAFLLESHTCAFYGRSCGAKTGNSRGASSMDVWRSTSV
jgi:hypothetical protein